MIKNGYTCIVLHGSKGIGIGTIECSNVIRSLALFPLCTRL